MTTLYEFRCDACDLGFAARRPMADRDGPQSCPRCHGPARRVISTPQAHRGVWAEPRDPEDLRTTKEIWE